MADRKAPERDMTMISAISLALGGLQAATGRFERTASTSSLSVLRYFCC